MNSYFIVSSPHSDLLWEQSWFYECIPYDDVDRCCVYLVPHNRVEELFGEYHTFSIYGELDENYSTNPSQYRLDFPE
jgi:hypothetical protein